MRRKTRRPLRKQSPCDLNWLGCGSQNNNNNDTDVLHTKSLFHVKKPFSLIELEWCHVYRLQNFVSGDSANPQPLTTPHIPPPPPALLIVSITTHHHPHTPPQCSNPFGWNQYIHWNYSALVAFPKETWKSLSLSVCVWISFYSSWHLSFLENRGWKRKIFFFLLLVLKPRRFATFWPQSHSSEILALGEGWACVQSLGTSSRQIKQLKGHDVGFPSDRKS